MLAALYASRQPEAVQYEIYDALKSRQIPLSEPIYAFLFPPEPSRAGRSLKQILADLRDLPRRQIRRWTHQESAEYYRSLEQTLEFMETSLENKHAE